MLNPTKGWKQVPVRNDVKTADDFKRFRIYRKRIRNANTSEMKTDYLNDSSWDLIRVSQLKLLSFNL